MAFYCLFFYEFLTELCFQSSVKQPLKKSELRAKFFFELSMTAEINDLGAKYMYIYFVKFTFISFRPFFKKCLTLKR